VSRQDPGAATGQVPYEPTRCTCQQPQVCIGLSTLHKPNPTTGVRGACSNSNCDCRRFTEKESDRA
jgi:hypothetical protein